MTEVPPHVQRIKDEYSELSNRTCKLDDFISGNELYRSLPSQKQSLMAAQYHTMRAYCTILAARLALEKE